MKSLIRAVQLIIALFITVCLAQDLEDRTLLTIDGSEYDAGTFMKVYRKNLDIVQEESQKDIDNYLDLYIDYRLKLMQAYELGLDKEEEYIKELSNYRSSLSQGYLTDTEVTDQLVKEVYNRSLIEVNASHILVKVGRGVEPADTLKAYNKILDIKKELDAGADFATMARNKSEGPSAGKAGELGWFGPFRMVYQFEDAAYETEKGNYTKPFRTDFGYHILKVNDKRQARGEVTTAHIMTFDKPTDSLKTAENRIREIYTQLENGKAFAELAREFSDDTRSATQGGKLRRFGTGGLNSPIFEDTALAMEEVGKYSEPFKSKYGWHIVKLLEKHPVPSFEKQQKQLKNQITKSPRSRKITKSFVSKLKELYKVSDSPTVTAEMLQVVGDSIMQSKWKYNADDSHDALNIITIQDSVFTAKGFYEFVENKQVKDSEKYNSKREKLQEYLDAYIEQSLISYYDANLERDNKDFAFIYNEFKEGILLFNLMERKIWGKAKEDTVALRTYYNEHKENYKWDKRLDIILTQNTTEEAAKKVQGLLRSGIAIDSIKSTLNIDNRTRTIISSGVVEKDYNRLPDNFEVKEGVSKIYHTDGDSFYKVINVLEVLEPSTKTFDEAIGEVINDYQQILEEEWESGLEEGREVKVNKRTLRKVKKYIEKSNRK